MNLHFQSKNYLMQGAHVSQNGGSNSLGSLGFREIRSSPSANSTALKEMSSGEITSLIKVRWDGGDENY